MFSCLMEMETRFLHKFGRGIQNQIPETSPRKVAKILVISDQISDTLYKNYGPENFKEIDCVISGADLPRYYL